MGGFDKFVEIVSQYWPIFGITALEIIMRVWPSDKIRSIFSIIGKVLSGLAKIFFLIADGLSHYVPDNPYTRGIMFKPEFHRLENFSTHVFRPRRRGVYRLLALPDLHIPDYSKEALNVVLKFARDYKPHGIVLMGDFMDMKSVSHWGDDEGSLLSEATEARKVLDQIEESTPRSDRFFLIGNHEDWLTQYVEKEAPALKGMYDINKLLSLGDYKVIPLNEILKIGDACFIHGYYTTQFHAKKHLDVFGVNVIYGHVHDVQSYSAVSVKGLREAISIGCLRTLNAPFLKNRPNNWSHAFAIIEFQPNGNYTRYVPIIIDGKFSFGGKMYG